MKTQNIKQSIGKLSCALMALALSACGGGGAPTTDAPATRLSSDVALADSLSGGFAEGISADPDTGDLYVGTDGALTGFILKAGSQQSSFSDWALASAVGAQGRMVAGTRVRNGVIYACVNFISQVWALKLSDKSVVSKMQLPGNVFCNDLTFDGAGNLFVTTNSSNGTSDVLYKLPTDTAQAGGTVPASAWKTWYVTPSSPLMGLNGLVYSSAMGKLLWAQGASIQSSITTGNTASASTEITLPTGWTVDGMQLTQTGNLLVVANSSNSQPSNLGAQLVNLSTGTKGATSAVVGGANCSTTVAIVGDDAFCTTITDSNNQPIEKVLRLAGAGKL